MTVFSQWEQEGLQPSEGWLQDVKRGEEEEENIMTLTYNSD